jgi:hypothetical protein
MTINLPISITIECDNCGDETEVPLTEYTGDPPTVGFEPTDIPDYWTEEDGEHFCPICSNIQEEE